MENKNLNTRELTIEETKSAGLLSCFECGIDLLDKFIHTELQSYVDSGSSRLFIVKEQDTVVAMFCLDSHNLFISNDAKEKMQCGIKPMPDVDAGMVDGYLDKLCFDSIEITYLAVEQEFQHSHIGSFVIEYIMQEVANDLVNKCDFVAVRALNNEDYSAIPFYKKCGFYPARDEQKNENLFMFRVVHR